MQLVHGPGASAGRLGQHRLRVRGAAGARQEGRRGPQLRQRARACGRGHLPDSGHRQVQPRRLRRQGLFGSRFLTYVFFVVAKTL